MTSSQIINFASGFIIGAALASAVFLGNTWPLLAPTLGPTAPIATAATTTLAVAALPPDTSGDVAVVNQPAGNTVTIQSVTVPPPGVWVAVEEIEADGSLGNVLGAAKVGYPHSNVEVDLLRPTMSNSKYAVVLYRDDNNGSFAVGKNSMYIDFMTDEPVEAPFSTTP